MISKPAISLKKSYGGATVERLRGDPNKSYGRGITYWAYFYGGSEPFAPVTRLFLAFLSAMFEACDMSPQ